LLLLLSGPGARAQQLLADGGFLAQPPAGVDALGAFRVTGGDVPDFPGPSAALQLDPSAGSRYRVRSSAGVRSDGWYRCTGWAYTSPDYNAPPSPELTIELVDAGDVPLDLSSAYTAVLGSIVHRGQWAYFDEWVPSNMAVSNRARLTFAPGHSTGVLQLAQLSVTFETFDSREDFDIEMLRIWRSTGGYATMVSCTRNTLPAAAECPSSYGSGATSLPWQSLARLRV
jgi:hypothetical protein